MATRYDGMVASYAEDDAGPDDPGGKLRWVPCNCAEPANLF